MSPSHVTIKVDNDSTWTSPSGPGDQLLMINRSPSIANTSKRSHGSSRYEPVNARSVRLDGSVRPPRRGSPSSRRCSPDRRRDRSRPGSPNFRQNSQNFRRGRGPRDKYRAWNGTPGTSRDSSRVRANGFHFGKHPPQNSRPPYFKNVRGGRGSPRFVPPGPSQRKFLLETPGGRFLNQSSGPARGSMPFRETHPRSNCRDASVFSRQDGDQFGRDLYSESPTGHRGIHPNSHFNQILEPACESTSQSSSGSISLSSSLKRRLGPAIRGCSPISDDEEGVKRSRQTENDAQSVMVGPDSTVSDSDIANGAETNVTTRLSTTKIDLKILFREVENPVEKATFTDQNLKRDTVENHICRAWEDDTAPNEGSDTPVEDASALLIAQAHPVLLNESSRINRMDSPAVGMRKRSNSCPTPDLCSSRHADPFVKFRLGQTHWLKGLLSHPKTEGESGSSIYIAPPDADSPIKFADLMEFLPSCDIAVQVDLSAYRTPVFLSKFAWIDPYEELRIRRTTCNSGTQTDVTAFFDAIQLLENPDVGHVGSRKYTAIMEKLQDNLSIAIDKAVWLRATDSEEEQLGVHFLQIIKISLLEQLRDFPNVAQPDRGVTRLALNMLLQAVIEVDGLADCMTALGIVTDLVDIIFSNMVFAPCRTLTCSILEVFLLRVSHFPGILSLSESLRKNGSASLEIRGSVQRVQLLLELRHSLVVTSCKKVPASSLSELSLQDVSLMATVQQAREEAVTNVLRNIVKKIKAYREILDKANAIDCHAAVYICLKNNGFMGWFLEVLRQISYDKTPESLRSSPALTVALKLLESLLQDENGPAFLADRSSHLADIVSVLNGIAVSSSQQNITELLDRIVYSLEIRKTVDLIGTRATTKETLHGAYARLASLLLRLNCSQMPGSFFTSSRCFQIISRSMDSSFKPYLKIIFSLILSQYDHPGILTFIDSLPVACDNLDRLDLHLWTNIRRISTNAKNMKSPGQLMMGLMSELEGVTRSNFQSSISAAHVVLDTFVFLCEDDRFRKILLSFKTESFQKIHQVAVSYFKKAASKPVDCLENLMWESVWVNSVRILGLFVQSSRNTLCALQNEDCSPADAADVSEPRREDLIKTLLAGILENFVVIFGADASIRPKTRAAVQTEIGRSCIPFVEEILDAGTDEILTATPLYAVIISIREDAISGDAEIHRTVAYCAFINSLHPAVAATIHDRNRKTALKQPMHVKNWETANKLDHDQLQKIISIGLCCTVVEGDGEFRLWLWRYCELSGSCLDQAVSLLLFVVCQAVSEELDCDILVVMLLKLASFFRIPFLQLKAAEFLLAEELTTGWRPRMFDSVLKLVRDGPVYTENHRQAFLLPIGRILVCLLTSMPASKDPAILCKMKEIAAAVIFRLQKEANVPVIICLWPIINQLFQSDDGISAFLSQSGSYPVLNWLLVGIALDVRFDPNFPSRVTLARNIVAGFFTLTNRGSTRRSVSLCDLRVLASMNIAYTRNFDPDNPTYRIPQNRDPDAVLTARFTEADEKLTASIPDTVRSFQHIMQSMLADFSGVDDQNRQYFLRKGEDSRLAGQMKRPLDMVSRDQFKKTFFSLSSASPDDLHGQWQEKEVKFYLFVESDPADVDGRFLADDEMIARRDLDDWLRRKVGRDLSDASL